MTLLSSPRTWTRTALIGGAALVAAVAVTIAIGIQADESTSAPPAARPTTAATFPVGEPLRTYVDPVRGTLHLDGVVEPGHWVAATTVGDLTFGYPAGHDATIAVFVGTDRVGALHPVAWSPRSDVKVAPHRRTIAWSEVRGTQASIVVADVTPAGIHRVGRRSVGTLALGSDNESREQLISVDDDHTVTYGGVLGGHSWTPGHEPEAAEISDFEYGPSGFPDSAQDIQLNRPGTWGAWLRDPANPGAAGEVVRFTAVVVQQRDVPGTRTKIVMPAAYADVEGLWWESDTDIVLEIHSGGPLVSGYVRCDVSDHRCERAPTPSAD